MKNSLTMGLLTTTLLTLGACSSDGTGSTVNTPTPEAPTSEVTPSETELEPTQADVTLTAAPTPTEGGFEPTQADVTPTAAPTPTEVGFEPTETESTPTPVDTPSPTAIEYIPQSNEEHLEMLADLGFDTKLGDRMGPDGGELPESWHPLRSRHVMLNPLREIYLAGVDYNGKRQVLLDDAQHGYNELPFHGLDDSWVNYTYKNGIAVDTDDDGIEEIVLVYLDYTVQTLKFTILDPNDERPYKTGVIDDMDENPALGTLSQPSLATGDLDGDGAAEVAVGFGHLYVLESDGNNGFLWRPTPRVFPEFHDVSVAIGNIDQDREDELVVTYATSDGPYGKGHYEIVDGGNIYNPVQSGELKVHQTDNLYREYKNAKVAIGNIDHYDDGVDDIVFAGGDWADSWNHSFFAMKYNPDAQTGAQFSMRDWTHNIAYAYGESTPRTLVLFDWDGDGDKEFFSAGRLAGLNASGAPEDLGNMSAEGGSNLRRAAAGDVDGDAKEELVLLEDSDGGKSWLKIIEQDDNGAYHPKVQTLLAATGSGSQVIVLPNADEDTAVLRYDGQHELLFTPAQLLAVMASPPYQSGIGQDVSVTKATFGKSYGSGASASESVGMSVGFSVGSAVKDPLGVAEANQSVTVERAFDWTASQSKTKQTYHSYTTAAGEDKVVFTTTPFDVYYYTVVSSPNVDAVGDLVTVSMPRQPQTLGSTVQFYNDHNGGGLDVDSDVWSHQPGEVWSYPSEDEKDSLLELAEADHPGYERLESGPIQVDQSGYNTVGLAPGTGSSNSHSTSFSATYEWELEAASVTVGGSVGYQYGHTYEFSTTEESFFEGSVGAIPGDNYAENAYCYGLMVYPGSVGTESYLVLNWWTQNGCG